MKRVLLFFALSGAVVSAAGLADVRKVYMLPMSGSLDQYLANRLTNERVFEVVTDPALADAVFTERIGEGFEQKLSELLPEPEPPKDAAAAEDKKPAEGLDVRGDVGPGSATINKLSRPGAMSTISRSRGTVFLVDTKSRQVVWSAFEPPKDSSARQLDHTASLLTARLKRELKKK